MKNINLRRFLLIIAVIFACIFGVLVLVLLNTSSKMDAAKKKATTEYKYHFALIRSESNDLMWDDIYKGAREAGLKLDAYVEDFGKQLDTKYSQLDLLKMAVASEVDGIILENDGSKEMERIIKEASIDREKAWENNQVGAKKPIAFITVLNNDAPNSGRISFVSPNDETIGDMYGKHIVALANGEVTYVASGNNGNEIEVEKSSTKRVRILVESMETGGNPNQLYSSINKAISASLSNVNIEPTIIKSGEKFASEESIRNIVLSKNPPDIMVCLTSVDTASAYQAIIDYNMVGKIKIVGYYYSPEIIEGIDKGIIDSTIVVDAKAIGKSAVNTIVEYEKSKNKMVNEFVTVKANLVTLDNISEYRNEEGKEA